ncbi:reactive intermediate/imine deaminase [Candidatus Roizmanbacteria bacterium CG_4_9_14_0_2_um_filter_39_13]|uniref:Reactive intermediate/imine deaminase n=2 Tax=Candidatus Roizmaniibacteriota TaxID=1752723 RepID=A0A2M8EWQ4_9BACT|nr:MAG: reactive intermediate/imine deaminase [Candidatus Roizmanbacteria bacterium CG_4_10_14_0_2_um_filter_39_12]PJC30306.1 MAG: reactive intermediate/imine deaminase [Candidatus Roizmanbacteria bacterium CG_4_9_14_0_2_um_filter_39_13]PJE62176.1 MAG: reactive intermediate/imine deaminase [Candidatus Roizmanbacteria bacterium CG10_big_fil_rev_8_21_14_0_10_39_12]
MKYIQPNKAAKVVGPYSQAIEHNGFVFTAGQIGKDPKTDVLLEGIEQQTEQVLKNIELILEAVGLSRNHIVKTTVFIVNMDDYAKMNEVYGNFFRDHFPARSTVQVVKLPAGALIEIEVIAAK